MLSLCLDARTLDRQPCYGILNSLPHPTLVEMIAVAGYDFVILDLEHLPHQEVLLQQAIQVAQAGGCAPLVRVPGPEHKLIGRILDMGAHGIVLPQVESAEQVLAARAAMRFAPQGKRGITGGSPTGFGSLPLADYIERANQGLLLVAMLESRAGMAALDEILAVEGLGLVMEGALDLALDMELGPQPEHPEVQRLIRQLAQRCQAAGIPFCANPRSEQQLQHWQQAGVRTFLCGEDRGFLFRALRQRLQDIQSPANR